MIKGQPTKHVGIYKLPTGEWLVRKQVKDPATGKYRDTSRKLPAEMPIEEALSEQAKLGTSLSRTAPAAGGKRFLEYALETIEHRKDTGRIESPATDEKYGIFLQKHLVRWHDFYLSQITRDEVKKWHGTLGKLVRDKKYTPSSVNSIWSFFRSIVVDASADYNLPDPTLRLGLIVNSGHKIYTLAEPNSLRPEELPAFFRAAWKYERDHYAMLALGLLTGRRPSELRPLRHRGRNTDLNWETGELQIRRSQTIGEALEFTKTKKDVGAWLPTSLLDILRRHVGDLCGHRAESDLLFPGFTGTAPYVCKWVLRKPLANICEKAGIKKHITPRFMRRTYNDLCRKAKVSDTVARAMSGHATVEMREWYSTLGDNEGRQALSRMVTVAGIS